MDLISVRVRRDLFQGETKLQANCRRYSLNNTAKIDKGRFIFIRKCAQYLQAQASCGLTRIQKSCGQNCENFEASFYSSTSPFSFAYVFARRALICNEVF